MNYIECGYKNYAELARFAPEYPDAEQRGPFIVMRDQPETSFLARATITNIASFDEEDRAIAFIGNCEGYRGEFLRIEQDGQTFFDAEWDETLGRYLNR